MKPLDQYRSTGAAATNHAANLQNSFDSQCTILDKLMNFAESAYMHHAVDKAHNTLIGLKLTTKLSTPGIYIRRNGNKAEKLILE